MPRVIVVDNGKQFDGKKFQNFYKGLTIDLRFPSIAHPQSNGQVKFINKIIKQTLKQNLDEAKGLQAEKLPKILQAYKTTHTNNTGKTPFKFTFRVQAVILVEMGLPSFKHAHYDKQKNNEQI